MSGSTGTDEKKAVSSIVQMIPAAVDMKETDGPGNLYALSAVLWMGILAGYCTKKRAIQLAQMPVPQRSV